MTDVNSSGPRTRVDSTAEAIRRDVISGVLGPGSRLAVDDVRERYGVGASTVREALALLLPEGLVEAQGSRGYTVAPISIEDAADISRARVVLERHALSESILAGDDDWEASIVAAYHRLSKLEGSAGDAADGLEDEWELRNRQFHSALLGACESRWVLRLNDMLHHHSERYRRLAITHRVGARDVAEEHRQLMEATLARDIEAACSIATDHIMSTYEGLAESFLVTDS